MIRNLLPWTAGCLLAAFAVSSCESDDVDYGPISAAIEIGVEEVTPSSAKIRLTTEQENVASYKIVKPTPISEFEYAAHDAIDRLAFIEERGEAAGAPFEQTLAGLMPKVEYSFAVVGLDASGQRITAPTFARFTTAYASSLVEARFETNPDETFTFTGKITPNAYTVSYRYIFDSDHNEATEAELRALLEAGGSGVKTDKGVKELELVKSDKAGVTLAVLSYDDANRPGEFTSTFVSTEDMASVIVDGKETQLARPTEGVDIFEGKVAVPAKSGFTVEINKVAYGFAPYSGNGGVGKVENMMSAAPYYSSSTIADSRGYDCKMAVGRMAATADGGNDFWTNLSEDAHILVRVDLTYADGTPRGASSAAAGRIDSVAQSFAAFSPYADRDRVQTALTAALAGLRDRERRLIRIYAPAFLPEERAPGYVSTYGPGFRENGGQYTHAAVWLALALHRAGRREEAAALAEDMALSLTAPEYGAEPFVLPADIAYAPGKEGRAGWSWYTGAAGWYLRLLRELYGAEP